LIVEKSWICDFRSTEKVFSEPTSPHWALRGGVLVTGKEIGVVHVLLARYRVYGEAAFCPAAKTTTKVCNRLEPYVLQQLRCESRAPATLAVENKFLTGEGLAKLILERFVTIYCAYKFFQIIYIVGVR
jgi:hypothetical protein